MSRPRKNLKLRKYVDPNRWKWDRNHRAILEELGKEPKKLKSVLELQKATGIGSRQTIYDHLEALKNEEQVYRVGAKWSVADKGIIELEKLKTLSFLFQLQGRGAWSLKQEVWEQIYAGAKPTFPGLQKEKHREAIRKAQLGSEILVNPYQMLILGPNPEYLREIPINLFKKGFEMCTGILEILYKHMENTDGLTAEDLRFAIVLIHDPVSTHAFKFTKDSNV